MVRVSLHTSVKYMVPYRFSKHQNAKTFGNLFVSFSTAEGSLAPPEGAIMLCVEDRAGRFLVFYQGATYIAVRMMFRLLTEETAK